MMQWLLYCGDLYILKCMEEAIIDFYNYQPSKPSYYRRTRLFVLLYCFTPNPLLLSLQD